MGLEQLDGRRSRRSTRSRKSRHSTVRKPMKRITRTSVIEPTLESIFEDPIDSDSNDDDQLKELQNILHIAKTPHSKRTSTLQEILDAKEGVSAKGRISLSYNQSCSRR